MGVGGVMGCVSGADHLLIRVRRRRDIARAGTGGSGGGVHGWGRGHAAGVPYTLHHTPCTPTPYTLRPTPYTLHPTPYAPHPTPYTLHPSPNTLHQVSRTPRAFAEGVQWFSRCFYLLLWTLVLNDATVSGSFFSICYWAPIYASNVIMFRFRPQWFLLGTFLTWGVGFAAYPPGLCIAFDSVPTIQATTYHACLEEFYGHSSGTPLPNPYP